MIKNALASELSPYLLKHAHNPVAWQPWGPRAFELARSMDKPIFLSIGYATCHWCNVMEAESFEDAEAAAVLNDAFICIKVDREERSDVDGVYMEACQALTGRGGWPLTVLATPQGKPFFAGTYIPKHGRYGQLGLMELVPRVKELWSVSRQEVERSAQSITQALLKGAVTDPGEMPTKRAMNEAFAHLLATYDPKHGGFGQSMKFPTPHVILFLFEYSQRFGNQEATQMALHTLWAMRLGGIFDHLGLGFHRYSTDPEWRLPHFEKMLYDQALLLMAYAEAYQATKDMRYAQVAREIAGFVLADLTSPEGAFYSAISADSEGREGAHYLWRYEEVKEAIGADEMEGFARAYNLSPTGNVSDEASGQSHGENVLHISPSADFADIQQRYAPMRAALLTKRKTREAPLLDDKILCDCNGLMIAALARAGALIGEPSYIVAAERAMDFVLARMRTSEGRLLHSHRLGISGISAMSDDYANTCWAELELYRTTRKDAHLKQAITLCDTFIAQFWDRANGGFYQTSSDAEALIVRRKETHDAAVPSSNAVAAHVLRALHEFTSDEKYSALAAQLFKSMAEHIDASPGAQCHLLSALPAEG